MEKILRQFDNHADADLAGIVDVDRLTSEERFQAFMQIMAPHYHASTGFQRVCRTDDRKPRSVCDDWGVCLQPLSKSASHGWYWFSRRVRYWEWSSLTAASHRPASGESNPRRGRITFVSWLAHSQRTVTNCRRFFIAIYEVKFLRNSRYRKFKVFHSLCT